MTDDQLNLQQYLQDTAQQLEEAQVYLGHGTDNYWDEAVHLVLSCLGIPLDADTAVLEQPVDGEQQTRVKTWLVQRIEQRVPVPYLSGEAWFAGVPFAVNRDVLIPRSPLAELIEQDFAPWCMEPPRRVLDMCCGSGCIGIATALYLPESQVDLADLSVSALEVAQQNIQRHNVAQRVTTFESDLFAALPQDRLGSYDLIVSNPPYVDAQDMADLPAEYRHEPGLALASGEDGLDCVRRLLAEAGRFLSENGVLIVEVGNSWVALERAFPRVPFVWLEFARGGHGVFLLTNKDLAQYREHFAL